MEVGHPRQLEFTVQACDLILQATPTEAKAVLIKEKLEEVLATAAEAARYKTLSELIEPKAEEEEAPEDEDEEAATARKHNAAAAEMCRKLKAMRLRTQYTVKATTSPKSAAAAAPAYHAHRDGVTGKSSRVRCAF